MADVGIAVVVITVIVVAAVVLKVYPACIVW